MQPVTCTRDLRCVTAHPHSLALALGMHLCLCRCPCSLMVCNASRKKPSGAECSRVVWLWALNLYLLGGLKKRTAAVNDCRQHMILLNHANHFQEELLAPLRQSMWQAILLWLRMCGRSAYNMRAWCTHTHTLSLSHTHAPLRPCLASLSGSVSGPFNRGSFTPKR